MIKKRLTRIWTDAEKAAAIALLARNGGNMKRTVREFRTSDGAQISESTFRGWRDNPPPQPLIDAATASFDQFTNYAKDTLMKLAVGSNRAEWINRVLASKRPTDLTTVMGTLYDKIRLEEGKATQITEQRTLSGFLATAKWIEPEQKAEADDKLN
jgi:hypothetical protein